MAKVRLDKKALKATAMDESLPLKQRRDAAKTLRDDALNPLDEADFDPNTFESGANVGFTNIIPRKRMEPPKRLPTKGMRPKEIMVGQRIGQFESKQDLYLLVAWLSERVSDLEDEVKTLRGG